jgi:hypothetical protein
MILYIVKYVIVACVSIWAMRTKLKDKLYLFRCDWCNFTRLQKRTTLCHRCGRGVMQAIGET